MPNLASSRLKPFLLLACFLGAWVFLPPFLKPRLGDFFYEFQAPAWAATSLVRDLQTNLHLRAASRRELTESLRDLARENALYRLELSRRQDLQDYAARLEALLRLPSLPQHDYEIARVIRRDQAAWWQRLIIGKGSNYAIPVGAAVVFDGGVVGRVTRVHAYSSEVELVSSPAFRMAATFARDPRPVTYQGAAQALLFSPTGRVADAPSDLHPSPSEPLLLVSSHLGGVFPSGLVIGKVAQLETGRDGLFQTGAVQLDPRLLTLQEVAVLLPLEPGRP